MSSGTSYFDQVSSQLEVTVGKQLSDRPSVVEGQGVELGGGRIIE